MPRKKSAQISLSLGSTLKARDLPFSKIEMAVFMARVLEELGEDTKLKQARKVLGTAHQKMGVFLCSDAEIREYQKSFRRLDRATDVLSFPTLEWSAEEIANLPASELSLGDLVVSLPAVARGAQRGRRTLREEFLEVFIHGILHLLGYDHVLKNAGVSLKGAQKMRKLQKQLFLKLRTDIKKSYVSKRVA